MSESGIEKVVGKSKRVRLGNGEVIEVKKLALGKYAQLLLALRELPSSVVDDFQNIDTEDNEKLIQAVFGIFGNAWGKVLDIIAIGSGVDRERLENDPDIGLEGGVDLFLAIYEVNNLQSVIGKVKNVIARAR